MRSKLIAGFAFAIGIGISLSSMGHSLHASNVMPDYRNMVTERVITEKRTDLKTAYEQYLQLQTALAKDEAAKAQKSAAALATSLKEVKNADAAAKAAGTISQTSDLAAQRQAFVTLSASMIKLMKAQKPEGVMPYIHFCPMANHNKGGYWLSNDKAIHNPYFGKKMSSCGKTTGMIM